jgi:hypothetical protein
MYTLENYGCHLFNVCTKGTMCPSLHVDAQARLSVRVCAFVIATRKKLVESEHYMRDETTLDKWQRASGSTTGLCTEPSGEERGARSDPTNAGGRGL